MQMPQGKMRLFEWNLVDITVNVCVYAGAQNTLKPKYPTRLYASISSFHTFCCIRSVCGSQRSVFGCATVLLNDPYAPRARFTWDIISDQADAFFTEFVLRYVKTLRMVCTVQHCTTHATCSAALASRPTYLVHLTRALHPARSLCSHAHVALDSVLYESFALEYRVDLFAVVFRRAFFVYTTLSSNWKGTAPEVSDPLWWSHGRLGRWHDHCEPTPCLLRHMAFRGLGGVLCWTWAVNGTTHWNAFIYCVALF